MRNGSSGERLREVERGLERLKKVVTMNISIGSDHAGFAYKEAIKMHLTQAGHQVSDCGTFTEASCDYPDYAHAVATSVEKGETEMGVLICGSANGVCITANKHAGIRAALCWETEIASLARAHNNANVVCLPARFISMELALAITDTFLSTSFEGGRHATRVGKI
jgi:ribose 5-phosphate isomerase B